MWTLAGLKGESSDDVTSGGGDVRLIRELSDDLSGVEKELSKDVAEGS